MTTILKLSEAEIGKKYVSAGHEIVIGGQRTALEVPCQHLGKKIEGEVFPPESGLGDYTESLLSTIGITKDRWAGIVEKFGIETKDDGGCGGCNWRHRMMNWVGGYFGLGRGKGPELKAALEQLVQVTGLKPRPVYECAIYGKCVPTFKPNDELREAIKKDMGAACCLGCPSYSRLGEQDNA